MRCLHLLVCLTLTLALSAPAEAGGSYGSYGSYGSGGSSGGYVHGSSGGGLLSGLRARIAARHSGSSGGASSGGASSGGSSGGAYVASYASAGSSGGSSGGGLFSRVRAHIQAKRAARGSSGGYTVGYSSGGASSGGASYSSGGVSYSSGGASYGGSSGGYYTSSYVASPVSYGSVGGYSAPVNYGAPMIQSGYPVDSYPSGAIIDSGSQPVQGSPSQGESSSQGGAAAIDGTVIDSGASYESRKPAIDDDAALLTVAVPVESALVTVNGHETSSDGTIRQFMSRGLKEGYLYTYEVVVTYDLDGQSQSDSKTIKLRPGDMERLVFKQDVQAEATAEQAEPVVEATDAAEAKADASVENEQDVTETVVQIHVPANAVVTLAGNETTGYGRVRTFRTTQLAPGQAWENYTVVVTAKVNGRDIRNERTVNVAAGSTVELDFDFNATTLAMR